MSARKKTERATEHKMENYRMQKSTAASFARTRQRKKEQP